MSSTYARKLAALDAGTLDAAGFSHRDHLSVAWKALRADEFSTAAARYASGLRRLTARAGVPELLRADYITRRFAGTDLGSELARRVALLPAGAA